MRWNLQLYYISKDYPLLCLVQLIWCGHTLHGALARNADCAMLASCRIWFIFLIDWTNQWIEKLKLWSCSSSSQHKRAPWLNCRQLNNGKIRSTAALYIRTQKHCIHKWWIEMEKESQRHEYTQRAWRNWRHNKLHAYRQTQMSTHNKQSPDRSIDGWIRLPVRNATQFVCANQTLFYTIHSIPFYWNIKLKSKRFIFVGTMKIIQLRINELNEIDWVTGKFLFFLSCSISIFLCFRELCVYAIRISKILLYLWYRYFPVFPCASNCAEQWHTSISPVWSGAIDLFQMEFNWIFSAFI